MRHAWILSGGAVSLILLAMVCIPRHLSSPPWPTAEASTIFHAGFEQGSVVFRGSLQVLAKSPITFEFYRATITTKEQEALDHVMTPFRRTLNRSIEIAGHTQGVDEANDNLLVNRHSDGSATRYRTGHRATNALIAIGNGSTRSPHMRDIRQAFNRTIASTC